MYRTLLALLLLSLPIRAQALPFPPEEPGPMPVTAVEGSFRNPSNRDVIPYRVYLPSATSTLPQQGKPYRVAFLYHGFSLTKDVLAGYGELLASHGIVTVLPDRSAIIDSWRQTTNMIYAIDSFQTLNDTASSPYYKMLNLDEIGVMGHSQGGKFAFQVAANDPRCTVVAGLDPVDTPFDGQVVPSMMASVRGACLVVGTDSPPDLCVNPNVNFQRFYAFSPQPRLSVELIGGDHCSMMTTYPYCPCIAARNPEFTLNSAMRLTSAWFRRYLLDDLEMDEYLTGSQAQEEVSAGRWVIQSDIPTPTPVPGAEATRVLLAGFAGSEVSSKSGGTLTLWAITDHGADPLQLFIDHLPTGARMPGSTTAIDLRTLEVPVGPDVPAGRFLLALGIEQPQWPYLSVSP